MSHRVSLALVLLLSLAGCTSSPPAPRPSSAMRLVAFDSCQQLEKDLRAAAKDSVGAYGFPGDAPVAEVMDLGGARSMASAAKAPSFSGTNNHEADADEPNIVKTDGKRIVTLDGSTLRVVDATTRRPTGKLDVGAVGGNLLLSGDTALVLAGGGGPGGAITYKRGLPRTETQLLLVDLTGTPRIISRYSSERASLLDARLTGSTARVVLRSTPGIAFPELPTVNDESKRIKANRKAIDKAAAEAWLPSWTVTDAAGTSSAGRLACGQVTRPAAYSGSALVSVLTFDLGKATLGDGDPVAVVADGDTVYATGTSLYLASDQRWRLDRGLGRAALPVREETEVYRFTTQATGPVTYAAAGTVPGFLINQYALSEWDGHLRVATTSGEQSAVRVLEQQGDKLTQVGVVDGLGKGERIYSVRFLGARGYVVTFKQTDPLYSLDLSVPAKPEVTGELKITGYSAHLQPAGDNRLIGIGQEADTTGRVQGTQVSLFDVADPASPRRLAQHQVPGGQSEAEYDPHALLWWPATQLLVVPVASLSFDGGGASALALRVTDQGVTRVGTFDRPGIRRSLVIGDTLWTVADGGLQASNLSTLDQVAWLPND